MASQVSQLMCAYGNCREVMAAKQGVSVTYYGIIARFCGWPHATLYCASKVVGCFNEAPLEQIEAIITSQVSVKGG